MRIQQENWYVRFHKDPVDLVAANASVRMSTTIRHDALKSASRAETRRLRYITKPQGATALPPLASGIQNPECQNRPGDAKEKGIPCCKSCTANSSRQTRAPVTLPLDRSRTQMRISSLGPCARPPRLTWRVSERYFAVSRELEAHRNTWANQWPSWLSEGRRG